MKVMKQLTKDLEARLKASTDLQEIHQIGIADKKLACVHNIVDQARSTGLESEEWKQVYGVCTTRLQLEPKVHSHMIVIMM